MCSAVPIAWVLRGKNYLSFEQEFAKCSEFLSLFSDLGLRSFSDRAQPSCFVCLFVPLLQNPWHTQGTTSKSPLLSCVCVVWFDMTQFMHLLSPMCVCAKLGIAEKQSQLTKVTTSQKCYYTLLFCFYIPMQNSEPYLKNILTVSLWNFICTLCI